MTKSTKIRSANVKLNDYSDAFDKDVKGLMLRGVSVVNDIVLTLAKLRGEPFFYRFGRDGESTFCSQEELDEFLGDDKEDAERFSRCSGSLNQPSHARPFFFGQKVWQPNRDAKTWDANKEAGYRLVESGFLPLFPDDSVPNRQKLIFLSKALAHYRSWKECDKLAKAEKNDFLKHIEEFKAEIDFKEYVWSKFQEFVQFAESNNVKINSKFAGICIKRKWGQTLKQGKVPKAKGYSKEMFESLLPSGQFHELADEIGVYSKLLCKIHRLERLKGYADLTLLDNMIDLHLGGGFLSFDMENEKGKLLFSMDVPRRDDPTQSELHRVSSWRTKYLQDLSLEKEGRGYAVSFRKSKSGDIQRGVIKEPHLRYRKGDYYVSLPINMPVRSAGYQDNLQHAMDYFNTSLLGDTKEYQTKKSSVKLGLTTLSVDLNLRPLAQMSVCKLERKENSKLGSFRVDGFGYANCKSLIRVGDLYSWKTHRDIAGFIEKCQSMRRGIGYYKSLKNGTQGDPPDLSNLLISPTEDAEKFKSELATAYCLVRREYRRLRGTWNTPDNLRAGELNSECLSWIFAVKEWLSIAISWRYCDKPPRKKGEQADPTDFSTIRDYLRRMKKGFLDKFGKMIRDCAVENNAHIVLLEDLSSFRFDQSNSSRQNYMLSLWSHRGIVDSIKSALELDGILVNEIDARRTSREDPITGEPAFRDISENKEHLYADRFGKSILLNSDEAACLNLQRRFWTRFADINQMSCQLSIVPVPVVDDAIIAVPNLKGKRVRGALKAQFGEEYCIFFKDGDAYRLKSVTKAIYNKCLKHVSGKHRRLNRMGNCWLEDEHFFEELEKIKHRYMVDVDSSEFFVA